MHKHRFIKASDSLLAWPLVVATPLASVTEMSTSPSAPVLAGIVTVGITQAFSILTDQLVHAIGANRMKPAAGASPGTAAKTGDITIPGGRR